MEQSIQAAGAGHVAVHQATQESLNGIRAEKIVFDPGEHTIATLFDVHVGDAQVDCGQGGQPQKTTAAVEAGGISGGLPILVCSATAEWKLSAFPPAGKLRQYVAADPFELRVKKLDLGVPLGGDGGEPPWSKRVNLDNLLLSAGPDGMEGRVEIARSAACDGGELEFSSADAAAWVVRGGIENIRDGGEWVGILPAPWKSLWKKLSPAGSFSLRIDRLDKSASASDFSGRIRSSAWSFTLPVVGLVPTGVNGFAGLRNGSIAWGEDAGFKSAAVVLLGQNGTLSGRIGAEGEGQLSVTIAEEKMTGALSPDAPRVLGNIFETLQPSARVRGGLDISISSLAEDSGDWKLALAFTGMKFHGAPSIVPGKVRLGLNGAPGGKGRGGVAQGELEIEDMTVAGLFSLKGTLGLSWGGEDLALEVGDLEIRPAMAPAGDETNGRLLGRLRTVNGGGGIEGKVSWVGTELRSSLLTALEMSGDAEIEVGTGIVLGDSSLQDARIPAGIFGEEELSYERGWSDWSVDGDGIHIAALELSGGQGALRATGTIGFDSHIDLVCVQAGEEEVEALKALPRDSKPADWTVVKGQAYRLSGKLEKPLVLLLKPDDRVLKQAGRNDAAGN